MPTDLITGLKIRYDNGLEAIFHTYDFVSARQVKEGIWMITVRERFFMFFHGKPLVYCGLGSRWRDTDGRPPSIYLGLYLCQCWIAVADKAGHPRPLTIHENPLQK